MQMPAPQALLVLVFRCARAGRRPNLTAFCKRFGLSVVQLQNAFDRLEAQGLVTLSPRGESLTLQGLAVGAALSKKVQVQKRPLASCRAAVAA
jgi:DNA-binding transcriptional MocR family regulator